MVFKWGGLISEVGLYCTAKIRLSPVYIKLSLLLSPALSSVLNRFVLSLYGTALIHYDGLKRSNYVRILFHQYTRLFLGKLHEILHI